MAVEEEQGDTPEETALLQQAAKTRKLIATLEQDSAGPGAPLHPFANETVTLAGGAWRLIPVVTGHCTKLVEAPQGDPRDKAGQCITFTRSSIDAFDMTIVNGGPAAGTLWVFNGGKRGFCKIYFDGEDWILREGGLGS